MRNCSYPKQDRASREALRKGSAVAINTVIVGTKRKKNRELNIRVIAQVKGDGCGISTGGDINNNARYYLFFTWSSQGVH